MNALSQPQLPPPRPSPSRTVARTSSRRRRVQLALTLETSVKLGVNLALSATAATALVRILPYHFSQQSKLQDIRLEVRATEERVARLRSDFSRYFDPQQVRSVMQEQTRRVDPQQRQVVWLENQNQQQQQQQQKPNSSP